jgi:hypothetical protein
LGWFFCRASLDEFLGLMAEVYRRLEDYPELGGKSGGFT